MNKLNKHLKKETLSLYKFKSAFDYLNDTTTTGTGTNDPTSTLTLTTTHIFKK